MKSIPIGLYLAKRKWVRRRFEWNVSKVIGNDHCGKGISLYIKQKQWINILPMTNQA